MQVATAPEEGRGLDHGGSDRKLIQHRIPDTRAMCRRFKAQLEKWCYGHMRYFLALELAAI
jgi:hypothetical protein